MEGEAFINGFNGSTDLGLYIYYSELCYPNNQGSINTLEQINKINRSFLWREMDNHRKLHLISWDQVFLPKELGGLGLKDLREVNKIALARLAWRFVSKLHKLWM